MTLPKDAKALVGLEWEEQLGEICAIDAQRFALTVGDFNPSYFDDDYARARGLKGMIVPPTFLTAMISWGIGAPEDRLLSDGMPPGHGQQPENIRGLRRMAGGQNHKFHCPVYPGDALLRKTRITSVQERQGRSGNFVTMEWLDRYFNQQDELVLECEVTSILR